MMFIFYNYKKKDWNMKLSDYQNSNLSSSAGMLRDLILNYFSGIAAGLFKRKYFQWI
jgi:hypothetical protein